MDRFERQVDPEGVLAPEERVRRGRAAMRAYFTDLALRSSKARAKAGVAKRTAPGDKDRRQPTAHHPPESGGEVR